MSDGFDNITDSINYRLVYGIAARIVEPQTYRSRVFDPDDARDLADLRALVLEDLGSLDDAIPAAVVDEAVSDAIAGRKPRW